MVPHGPGTVKSLHGLDLLLPGERRCAQKWYVSCFLDQKWHVVFVVFVSSSSSIAFVAATPRCRSAIRTNTSCGAGSVACHVQVACLLSFLGAPWSQWCPDWCALGCSAAVAFGCVCSSHTSGWLRFFEVFAVVPLGVSCFLSYRVVGHFLARENVGAGRLFHRGIRLHAAAASCAHVSSSGGREPVAWVQNAVDRDIDIS